MIFEVFKEFISFNLQKITLKIFLILFAPLPLYALVLGGIAPPILLLLIVPAIGIRLGIIALLFFIIHA